jgi:hypothetical protein
MNTIDPRLRDFILFCAERRGNKWPAIYDEMAFVAGQKLFKGMGYADLKQIGLSLSLDNVDKTIRLVREVTGTTKPAGIIPVPEKGMPTSAVPSPQASC